MFWQLKKQNSNVGGIKASKRFQWGFVMCWLAVVDVVTSAANVSPRMCLVYKHGHLPHPTSGGFLHSRCSDFQIVCVDPLRQRLESSYLAVLYVLSLH